MYISILQPRYIESPYYNIPSNAFQQGNSQVGNNFNVQSKGSNQSNQFNKQRIEEMTKDLIAQPIKDSKKKRNFPPPEKRRAVSPVLVKMRKELSQANIDSSQNIRNFNGGNMTSRNLTSASKLNR